MFNFSYVWAPLSCRRCLLETFLNSWMLYRFSQSFWIMKHDDYIAVQKKLCVLVCRLMFVWFGFDYKLIASFHISYKFEQMITRWNFPTLWVYTPPDFCYDTLKSGEAWRDQETFHCWVILIYLLFEFSKLNFLLWRNENYEFLIHEFPLSSRRCLSFLPKISSSQCWVNVFMNSFILWYNEL